MVAWSRTIKSQWQTTDHRQRCLECGHPATFRVDERNPDTGAIFTQWRCTNHAAAYAYEHGMKFLEVR